MPTPSKDYRENPKRAVYVTGLIDQQLVDRISPTINEFRLESTDPITVYVDSPGGSIMLADTIRYHLQAPNPDGKACRLITVVTSRAGSAAADFVALGDYAIGYPYADLVYHGSRTTAGVDLTTEMATSMARSLQQSNEVCAVQLARRAFPRFVLRLSQFKDKFGEYVNGAPLSVLTPSLQKELSSGNARLVREAMKRQGNIADLSGSVFTHIARFKDGGAHLSIQKYEAEMLRAVVDYKTRLHKEEFWLLSESGLQEVTEDFNLLHDFHFGPQRKELEKWYALYGQLFLSEAEKQQYVALTEPAEEKAKWLLARSAPKLRPIWYLVISICRLIQTADYMLPSRQAYWLGFVDEAPGSGLPCLRTSAESQTDAGQVQASASAPRLAAAQV